MRPRPKEKPPEAAATASEGIRTARERVKLWGEPTEGLSGGKENLSASVRIPEAFPEGAPEHPKGWDYLAGVLVPRSGDVSRKGGEAGMRAPQGHAPGAPPLPSHNRNNSIQCYRLKRSKPGADPVDHTGRLWDERDNGWFTVFELSSPERKAAYKLRRNVQGFVNRWTRNHCAFLTLTDNEGVHPKEFGRRWNSFLTNEGDFIRAFCRVVEPQPKSGRVHYHLLVSVPWDMLPDSFAWEAFFEAQKEFKGSGRTQRFRELTRRYRESAGPETVAMWKRLRKVLPKYGLGRSEFLPVRKGHEALSEYVGKYLEAGLQMKRHNWKGVRRVETDRRTSHEWRQCVGQFAWVSEGAKAWRKRIGELATAAGATDLSGLTESLGARWAYRMRGAVCSADEQEWGDVLETVKRDRERREPVRTWAEWETVPRLPDDWEDRLRESWGLSEDSFVCVGPGGDEIPSPAFRVRRRNEQPENHSYLASKNFS